MKNIIFLFSLPRSGSTLIQRILGSHEKISTAAEPWLLLPFVYAVRQHGIFAEYDHGICNIAIRDFIEELPKKEEDYVNALASFAQTLYSKNTASAACYFLDKTPRYYLIIPEIIKLFPDAKFIFLFRNPLEVLSSIIETWCNGKLKLNNHYIDLYYGPNLLAEGYELIKDKSFYLKFDDFITNPKMEMENLCNYLEISFDSYMLDSFSGTKLNGRMGDQTGRFQYDKVEKEIDAKWKKTVNSKYKKKFFKKYLRDQSAKTLKTFGVKHEQLAKEVDQISTSKSGAVVDRGNLYFGHLLRLIEMGFFKQKLKHRISTGKRFVQHL